MANKKQINTKSCDRLRQLIDELNMNYADFGESVNLSEYTIRACVTGARRLTEDNARIITQKYPIVRFEWLMGWDDYRTIEQLKLDDIIEEANIFLKNPSEHTQRLYLIADVLREMGYSFEPLIWNSNILLELHENTRFLEKHWDMFSYFFTKQEIDNAYCRKKRDVYEEFGIPELLEEKPTYNKYADAEWIVNNSDEFLEYIEREATSREDLYKHRMSVTDKKFNIINNKTNEIYECTYAERDNLVNQIYNILMLLVVGSVNQLKRQNKTQSKNDDTVVKEE